MVKRELIAYLDAFLRIEQVKDSGPQGLQVDAGADEVTTVAFSTDSALPCIESAVQAGAQLLIVHHGLFWGHEQLLRGPFGAQVRRLFEAGLSLYGAHLALDAHPEVGNNAELARLFAVTVTRWWGDANGTPIGVLGDAPAGLTLADLVAQVGALLGVAPLVHAYGPAQVRRVAIVSGFGAPMAAEAQALGADTFLTGETSHASFYTAQALGINLIYAGHYATETVGLQALARHLAARFPLQTVWLDHPTGL
ncbi:MAG: Nif3-like dinuclear metal center hexameric protein [Anaerolineae bacterium]|uniref:Nif3-like dinuclear metal center hexameric protein n=1 Tax=Candidatus Amarolinea dominans TaxID=3140696 RepID=UPI001DC28536|nr:Nif3-like dinuclear metal center hexameric protein [Anaerolineae bacterium]MBK7201487.1 Nif3-like dinuclear metal center hexameric protein [Anaerolineae bacterium]MBK9094969.1 Nif3-like dinuclear metal center hexameric protein [Anaerolineae bacterium]